MVRLTVVAGPNRGAVYDLADGEVSIGRQAGNVIVLPSAKVSKKHCVLQVSGDSVVVSDAGSSNGTFINGVLVKSKRAARGDRISVGDFVLELRQQANRSVPAPFGPSSEGKVIPFPGANIGAVTATQNIGNTTSPEPVSLLEKVKKILTDKVMPIFYRLMFKQEWRIVFGLLCGATVVWNLLVSVGPLIEAKQRLIMKESAKRARFIARQLVDLNSAAIAQRAETRTNIGRAVNEPEVKAAFILDLNGRVIAPSERSNEVITSGEEGATVVRARKFADAGRFDGFSSSFGSVVVGAEPIEIFNTQLGKNVPVAMAIVSIDTNYAASDLGDVSFVYAEALIMMASLSILLFIVLYRVTLKPFEVLNDDIDRVLKGEMDQVTHEFKLSELDSLWEVVNATLQRIPKKTGAEGFSMGVEEDLSADSYLGVAQSLSAMPGAAVALLDGNGSIRHLSDVFQEMTGIRSDSTVGQPLSGVARDQAFSSFVADVLSRAQAGSEGVVEDFEFSGISYRFHVSAFGSAGGRPRSYLWVGLKTE